MTGTVAAAVPAAGVALESAVGRVEVSYAAAAAVGGDVAGYC